MLKILVGTDWKTNRDAILSSISLDVKNRRENCILMVPELVSHDAECRLANCAGDTASRYAEVLSFSRLARRVADEFSIGTQDCLDNGGRIAAMAAATKNITTKLKSYAGFLSRPEFLESLVDAVDEFKRCCISSEDLRAAAFRSDGIFAQKLEELALILDSYNAVTANGRQDPRDQMTWLLEHMETTDFAQSHVFYIDGFPDFTRQHMALLEHIILQSPSVTISFTCDCPGSRLMAYEKAGKTASEIIRFAKENFVNFSVSTIAPAMDPLMQVCGRIFQGSTDAMPAVADGLWLVRAENTQQECLCAVQRILSLVRSGCRYRDISVVCSEFSEYEAPLRLAFSRYHIPFYRSGTEDVLQKSVINSLMSAINAALNGFQQRDVLHFMKSVLSPLSDDACDLLENYSLIWGVRGIQWTKSFENHPEGLGKEWDNSSRERLEVLEGYRSLLISPIVELKGAFSFAKNLDDQLQALYDFVEKIGLASRMEQLAGEMEEIGDYRDAQILNQLWDILLKAFDQLHDMLGQSQWDADDFTRLLSLTLSQYDVGTIPTVLDSVVVGPVSAMRCHQVKHLVVVGAKEGSLPGYNGTSGVLTDREREQLRALDLPLSGGGLEGLQSEFAEIYGVFASATESITVTCGAEQPSFIYNRLSAMAGGDEKYAADIAILTTTDFDAAAYLSSQKDLSSAKTLEIETQYNELFSKANYDLGSVSPENIRELYGYILNLSATQIDNHGNCRFSYFLNYGVRAKEMKEAAVDPAEFGKYFHAVLEKTARHIMELGGFHQVTLEDTQKIASEYSDAYIREYFSAIDSARVSHLFERNVQELQLLIQELWEELSKSLFVPVQFELGFGEGKALPAVDVSGDTMQARLSGYVDRIDRWHDDNNNYFRVVDYKTGKKAFDYCDVFNGLGLQMLLYMYALEQGGESILGESPVSAGVQYFSARYLYMSEDSLLPNNEIEKIRGAELKRKGLVLSDENVISAMEPEGAPKRLSVSYNKRGELCGDIADAHQFEILRKYVFNTVRKMVNDISSGNITPNPYTRGDNHNACKYCPFGAVCHKASVPGRRNYATMKAQRFWEEIEKEVQYRA